MARPSKPGILNVGNSQNKKQKNERVLVESQLKGNEQLVFMIPDHLDDLAKQYYSFIVDELKNSNILSDVDIPLLEQTSDCLSKIRQCDDLINTLGLFYEEEDRYGHKRVVENVAVKTKLNLLTKYTQFCTQLGLSPSSRATLASKKIEAKEMEEDPLMKILKSK